MITADNNKSDMNREESSLTNDKNSSDKLDLNPIANSDMQNNEDLDESDEFTTYDETEKSNVPENDPIAESNEHTNDNRFNDRPTFNRTYDKNASDEPEVDSDSSGKFDGEVGI